MIGYGVHYIGKSSCVVWTPREAGAPVGLASPLQTQTRSLPQNVLPGLCLGFEWAPLPLLQGGKWMVNSPGVKNMVPLRTAGWQWFPTEVIVVYLVVWKCQQREWEAGSLALARSSTEWSSVVDLTSPVNFCCTLHLDLMMLPWLALCIRRLQLSPLDVVNSWLNDALPSVWCLSHTQNTGTCRHAKRYMFWGSCFSLSFLNF